MEFMCLGSGSKGNAYLLKHNEEYVLVECGFAFDDLLKKFVKNDILISQIKCVITTHSHNDHSKAVKDFRQFGINCYTPYEQELPTTINLTEWLSVYCFKVNHDCDACGFLFMEKNTNETLLFINDTNYFELEQSLCKLPLTYVCIECNHLFSKLEQLLNDADEDKKFKYIRQSNYHLSLINTIKMLNQLCLGNTKQIYLMHLSLEAGDPEIMKSQIENTYSIKTCVCNKHGNFI